MLFLYGRVATKDDAVWNVLIFLLNGLLFLLIGLQLRGIVVSSANHSLLTLIWQALLISLTVIVVRFLWIFSATSLLRLIRIRLVERELDLEELRGIG